MMVISQHFHLIALKKLLAGIQMASVPMLRLQNCMLSCSMCALRVLVDELAARKLVNDSKELQEVADQVLAWKKDNAKELRELNSTTAQSPGRKDKKNVQELGDQNSTGSDRETSQTKRPGKSHKPLSLDSDIMGPGFRMGSNLATTPPSSTRTSAGGVPAVLSFLEPSISDYFGVPADKAIFCKVLEAEGLDSWTPYFMRVMCASVPFSTLFLLSVVLRTLLLRCELAWRRDGAYRRLESWPRIYMLVCLSMAAKSL